LGGSDANRFRFLKELIPEVRNKLPRGMPNLVKLNTHDYTPQEGITPSLAVTYARWLADLEINGLEISCGSPVYSFMNMCRGDVPVKELVNSLPFWKRPIGKLMMKSLVGRYDLEEGYNLEAAKMIRPIMGNISLFAVGGFRHVSSMEGAVENGYTDFISMCHPFIKEPYLVKHIKEGKVKTASCTSCNKCLAAVANDMPVKCYEKGFPEN